MFSGFKYQVHCSHSNGMDMIAALLTNDLPDIVSIDVDKQEVGAIETAAWLKEHYPSIKVLPLSIEIVESLIKPVLQWRSWRCPKNRRALGDENCR
jgi:DNA-binding NarL/FixJ family response regulator